VWNQQDNNCQENNTELRNQGKHPERSNQDKKKEKTSEQKKQDRQRVTIVGRE
jgi:hypothetical protein